MVILNSCGSHGDKLRGQQPENTKYVKRRKVFVVRDFPNGFEQFSAQTNQIANESLNSLCSDEDLFERIYVASDSEDHSSEPFEIGVSMSVEQMIECDQEEAIQLGTDSWKSLDDSKIFIDQLETSKLESTDLFYDVDHTHQQDWAKTYFPRRRVFAVRSFPPGCGRDATHLSKEDCHIALAYSMNNGLGCNKFSVENEPSDKDDSTEPFEFEVGDRLSHEDSPSLVKLCTESFPKICAPQRRVSAIRFFPPGCGRNALYHNTSKEDSERALESSKKEGSGYEESSIKQALGRKSIKNDFPRASSSTSNIESERIAAMKNHVKPTHSSNFFQSQIKSQPVSGRKDADVEDLLKKSKKELTKTKLSRVSTNMSELQGKHRVIVLALMAAPRCPSRKGKTAFKTQSK